MIAFALWLSTIMLQPASGTELTGSWHWESTVQESGDLPEESLTIHLLASDGIVRGSACFVYEHGNRIDCPFDECNINGEIDSDGDVSVTIHSEYFDVNMNATAKFGDDVLLWSSSTYGPSVRPVTMKRLTSRKRNLNEICRGLSKE